MSHSHNSWTNQRILHDVLWRVIYDVHSCPDSLLDTIREVATDANPNRLKDRLVELQMGVLTDFASFIDGRRGPSDWPDLRLVNMETNEPLTSDLAAQISIVEGAVIDALEPPNSEQE